MVDRMGAVPFSRRWSTSAGSATGLTSLAGAAITVAGLCRNHTGFATARLFVLLAEISTGSCRPRPA